MVHRIGRKVMFWVRDITPPPLPTHARTQMVVIVVFDKKIRLITSRHNDNNKQTPKIRIRNIATSAENP